MQLDLIEGVDLSFGTTNHFGYVCSLPFPCPCPFGWYILSVLAHSSPWRTSSSRSIIWAGCQSLSLGFDDSEQSLATGFEAMQEEYADLNIERSQFKVQLMSGLS